jgi:ADP-heptose:LPS heptosyltransferase
MRIACVVVGSGIGNILQTVPFLNAMKEEYDKVFAHVTVIDVPGSQLLVKNIVDDFKTEKQIKKPYDFFKLPKRRSCPEYKTWFIDHKKKIPKNFSMEKVHYIDQDSPTFDVVLCPGGKRTWPVKLWPFWDDFCLLLEGRKVAIVGLGGEGFSHASRGGVIDLRGKLPLLHVGGLLKKAKLCIGHDSGLSHYAAALGTRTYVLFGGTDPVKCLPPANAIAIQKGLSCQPCHFRGMKKLVKGKVHMFLGCDTRPCLYDFTAQDFLNEIQRHGDLL